MRKTAKFVKGACSSTTAETSFDIARRCDRGFARTSTSPSTIVNTGRMFRIFAINACAPLSLPPRLRYSSVSGVPANWTLGTMLRAVDSASVKLPPSSMTCFAANAIQPVAIEALRESTCLIPFAARVRLLGARNRRGIRAADRRRDMNGNDLVVLLEQFVIHRLEIPRRWLRRSRKHILIAR